MRLGLSEEIGASLKSAETVKLLTERGLEPIPCSPSAFADFLRSEMTKYAAVIKRANVKID